MRIRKHVFLPVCLCVLLIFTVYVLLDTFVIERRVEATAEPQGVSEDVLNESALTQLSVPPQESSASEPVLTDSSYRDGKISIEITEPEPEPEPEPLPDDGGPTDGSLTDLMKEEAAAPQPSPQEEEDKNPDLKIEDVEVDELYTKDPDKLLAKLGP